MCWVHVDRAPSSSIVASVQGGPLFEDATTNGVSHLLEHLHLSYSPSHGSRKALSHAIDETADDLNARLGLDYVEYILSTSTSRLSPSIQLLCELLGVDPYPPDVIKTEKALILAEIQALGHHTETSVINSHLFCDHPSTLPPIGTEESVLSITDECLADFNRRIYQPCNIAVTIAGNIDTTDQFTARTLLSDYAEFSAKPLMSPASPRRRAGSIIRWSQSGIGAVVGFCVPGPIKKRERCCLDIVRFGLGLASAPKFERLRYGKVPIYEFSTLRYTVVDSEVFYTTGSVGVERQDAFVDVVLDQYLQLAALGPAAIDWCDTVVRKYRRHMEMSSFSPEAVALKCADEQRRSGGQVRVNCDDHTMLAISPEVVATTFSQCCTRDNLFVIYDGGRGILAERRIGRHIRAVCDPHLKIKTS